MRCVGFLFAVSFLLAVSGCAFTPHSGPYSGPQVRPSSLDDYYSKGGSYISFREKIIRQENDYAVKRIYLRSALGVIKIDYFKRSAASEELILVFPVLGGRNIFANYFAQYYAANGFDTAVVHRDSGFKNPENFERIEEVFKQNVIQDRIAIDFFESVYDKKSFGTFGISRGAINVAMTAGVDKRLKYNVLAMGGSDVVRIFRDSSEKGIQKFKRRVMKRKNFTEEEFYSFLKENIKTDPKNLASYIDAKNTLMFLSVFDRSVPFKHGLRLRETIGKPDTVFLMSGHYSSIAYTQFVKLVPPQSPICLFPMDYIETESLAFFKKSFGRGSFSIKQTIIRILQLPFNLVGGLIEKML